MDEERNRKLREALGKPGDVSPELADMFGGAYLDHPDDTGGSRIPSELVEISTETGGQFYEISNLLQRAIEAAPAISCEEHQSILLRHLKDFMRLEHSPITHEEGFATAKHVGSCTNQKCRKINTISTWNNVLTPKGMRDLYGEEIINWEIS